MFPKVNDIIENQDRFCLHMYTLAVQERIPLLESASFQVLTFQSPLSLLSVSFESSPKWNCLVELSHRAGVGYLITKASGSSGTWDEFKDEQEKKYWEILMKKNLRDIKRKLKIVDVKPNKEVGEDLKSKEGEVGSAAVPEVKPQIESVSINLELTSDAREQLKQGDEEPSAAISSLPLTSEQPLESLTAPMQAPTAIPPVPADIMKESEELRSNTGSFADSESEIRNGSPSVAEMEEESSEDDEETVFRGRAEEYRAGEWDWKEVEGGLVPMFWLASGRPFKASVKHYLEVGPISVPIILSGSPLLNWRNILQTRFCPLPTPDTSPDSRITFGYHQKFRTYIIASSQMHGFRTMLMARGTYASPNSFKMKCVESDYCQWTMTIKLEQTEQVEFWACQSVTGRHRGHKPLSEEDARAKWELEKDLREAPKVKQEKKRKSGASNLSVLSPTVTSEKPQKRQRISFDIPSEPIEPPSVGESSNYTFDLSTLPPLPNTSDPSSLEMNSPLSATLQPSQPDSAENHFPSNSTSSSSVIVHNQSLPEPQNHSFYSTLSAFFASSESLEIFATDTCILKFLNGGVVEEKELCRLLEMSEEEVEQLGDILGLTEEESRTLFKGLGGAAVGDADSEEGVEVALAV